MSDLEIPRLLDSLPSRVRGYIKSAWVKASSQTLGILKSLYPRVDLDVVADGWAANMTPKTANETMASFRDVATRVATMIGTAPYLDVHL